MRECRSDAVVIGGGLAGITAALDLAAAGARVALVERRRRLGGCTWSFRHHGHYVDNGQHVFLRCCHAYLAFLSRIGSAGDVELQPRLQITAIRPSRTPGATPLRGTLERNGLPAPLHLGGSVLRYPLMSLADRLGIGRAVLALRRLELDDPALDQETFASWLGRHGQGPGSLEALWDLITVATLNLPAREASAAAAAMVFRTGLLDDPSAGDIGWAKVPLGILHGERSAATLERSGVAVRLGETARAVRAGRSDAGGHRFEVTTDAGRLGADVVVAAVPHSAVGSLLPGGSLTDQDRLGQLGTSAIVNVHVVYDRPVTDLGFLAGVGSPVQWVFDRTGSSGLAGTGQYLAVSLSAADHLVGRHPEAITAEILAELEYLIPAARGAGVIDTIVTKERAATFRAAPGSGALRPGQSTSVAGLAVAGAWTATGWPATMEGAVRSGHAAAEAVLAHPARHPTTEEVA
jgi:squalene-associated FAD-dependent desaturase